MATKDAMNCGEHRLMEQYANTGGASGIVAYEVAADSITVEFRDGAIYLYTYASTGRSDVEQLKTLAQQGQGLNSFIARQVRHRYAQQIR